jgi:hypothetical protein
MMNLQHGDSGATFFGSSSSNDYSDFNERDAVTSKVVKMSTGNESNPYKEIENLIRENISKKIFLILPKNITHGLMIY